MSQENVELTAAPLSVSGGEVVYDRRRDANGLFAHLHPAVEVHPLTRAMLEGVAGKKVESQSNPWPLGFSVCETLA